MMKNLISTLFIYILTAGFCVAQSNKLQATHQLNWHSPQIIAEINKSVLTFDESFCLDNSLLPYFSTKKDLNLDETLDSIKIINPKYIELSKQEELAIEENLKAIKNEIVIKTDYDSERRSKKVFISFLPIIKQNGVYKKLIQFTIQYQIKKTSSLRGTNSTSNLHSFVSNSALSSGKWIKIGVTQSGIYKITYENLAAWGINNPANANIFGYGGAMLPENFLENKFDDLPQLSVYKQKGNDGVFRPGDYILFYAQGPQSWKYDSSNKIFKRILNPYSTIAYYFISSDVGTEKLIQNKTAVGATATTIVTEYLDRQIHETETTNIISSGKEWYGETYNHLTNRDFSFSFNNISASKAATVTADAAAKAGSITSLSIGQNNSYLGGLSFSAIGEYDGAKDSNANFSFTPNNSEITINTTFYGSNGNAWLNYITVNAYRNLILSESAQFFRCPDIVANNQIAEFQIQGNGGYLIWDISNHTNIQGLASNFSNNNYSYTDSASVLKEYVAVNPAAQYPTPAKIADVANQNLHAMPQTNFVIIASPEFVTQATALAKKHEQVDGISTLVVTPEQIYNEYSSGTPDATAYRWFMKMFYDRAQTSNEQPQSLLLFGDGTYDNRTLETKNAKVNKLLTYQASTSLNEINSYVCDDYFGLLNDNDGGNISSNQIDIGVGRIPASTADQATSMVEKIAEYMDNSQNGYWKNLICYLADDISPEDHFDTLHIGQSNQLANYIEKNYSNFQTKRIFLDSYTQEVQASGESYPLAKEKLFNLINSGVFLINYTGHGSTEGLANEKIISRSDAINLYNKILPVFVTATCSFSRFDNTQSSAGEELFMNPHGGAIGLFTTTRTVYANSNYELNKSFNKFAYNLENGKGLSLGEIMKRTKNDRAGDANRLSFTLLADPALRLPIPSNKITISEVSSNSNTVADTIQALSTVTIKGQISDQNSNKLSQFNGIITANIFDKSVKTTTLANNGGQNYTYKDWKNLVFSGRAEVQAGEFSLSFLVPKDIAYNYGKGRINLYANDDINKLEANGYYNEITIGGTKSDFLFEYNGPQINMQLNSNSFRNGSTVDPSSVLYAQLYDENGINAGGYSIGHDISISLSNEPNNSIILNEYYKTNLGDFRSGTLEYKLPLLENGDYSLKMKAWDVLNNSGEQSIQFKVKDSKIPELNNCYAAPNPATDYVRFVFKHDQPLSKLKMSVDIINLNGELLWTHSKTDYFENNDAYIEWDLIGHTGKKMNKGLYIYRINIESEEDGIIASEANKLLVK